MAREISFQQRNGRILIDGEPFDWDLDDMAIAEANRHAGNPEFMRAIHNDIMGHLLESLEAVLGFRPSMVQVCEALKMGVISK